jgi:hypothetical protein
MSFHAFARAHGVELPDRLDASERIRRCGTTEKPRSTNGAYVWDGSRGWVYAWDGEAQVKWYDDPNAKPWTEEEKRAWKAKQDAQRARQELRYRQAALHAADLLRDTVPGQHDYLVSKRLPEIMGLVMPTGELFVPMRNLGTNDLQGAQVIRWLPDERKWEKKMLTGMRAKGAVLRIGPKSAAEVIYCEGYATGLSIDMAARQGRLNAAVLVCFSAGNMVHVAEQMKASTLRRFVFADNDKSGTGEQSAKDTGLPYCMADEEGWDANDVHAKRGLMALQAVLMKLRTGSG